NTGTITIDGVAIHYSHVNAPITDTTAITSLNIAGSFAAETFNLADGPVAGGVQTTRFDNGGLSFDEVHFANKTGVTINGNGGSDPLNVTIVTTSPSLSTLASTGSNAGNTVNILAIPAGLTATLNTGTGNDTITVGDAGNTLNSTLGTINVDGQ